MTLLNISTNFALMTMAITFIALVLLIGVSWLVWAVRNKKLPSLIPVKTEATATAANLQSGDHVTQAVREELKTAKYVSLGVGKDFLWEFFFQQLHSANLKPKLIAGKEAEFLGFKDAIFAWVLEHEAVKFVITMDKNDWEASRTIADIPIKSYIENEVVVVGSELTLHIPTENCAEQCQTEVVTILRQAAKVSACSLAPVPREVPPATLFTLTLDHNRNLTLSMSNVTYNPMDSPLLDAQYPSTVVDYKGSIYQPPFSLVVPRCIAALQAGENGIIIGPTGSGKTTLLLNLVAMAAKEKVAVFKISFDVLASNVPGLFESILSQCKQRANTMKAERMLFILDEGKRAVKTGTASEAVTAVLRDFMEGIADEAIKKSVLLCMTANDVSEVDQEIIRPGRTSFIVTIGQLDNQQAARLRDVIEKVRPDLKYVKDRFPKAFPTTCNHVWKSFTLKGGPDFGEGFEQYKVQPTKVALPKTA